MQNSPSIILTGAKPCVLPGYAIIKHKNNQYDCTSFIMTGFNHAAVGGLLAVYLPLPAAVPLAFLSHFALDMLPHYGIPHKNRDASLFWRIFTTADVLLALVVLGGMSLFVWDRPEIVLCGLVAASPDFVWIKRILETRSFDLSENRSRFTRWHVGIQRLERPWGLYLELVLAAGLYVMLGRSVA